MPSTSGSTPFSSVLGTTVERERPSCLVDLGLDQLIDTLTGGRAEYDLRGWFESPLSSATDVAYRQDALRDVETDAVTQAVTAFVNAMSSVRRWLANREKVRHPVQQQTWLLTAATTYVHAVAALADALPEAEPSSTAFCGFSDALVELVSGEEFDRLQHDVTTTRERVDRVTYRLVIRGDQVDVTRPQDEPDYAADILETFTRFQLRDGQSHRAEMRHLLEMNHVEEAVVERVARLEPEAFTALERFASDHGRFTHKLVVDFDREVQFYLAAAELGRRLENAGLPTCYPAVRDPGLDEGDDTPTLHVHDGYDATLAVRVDTGSDQRRRSVVTNDVEMTRTKRLLVVTGPNQGGKTTYARTVGQVAYLAALGVRVPARECALVLPDLVLTHFERGENLADLTGKLDDDLVRVRDILQAATQASLVILNEIFTSTASADAAWLGERVLDKITDRGCRCVCVTFLDELSTINETAVSLVADVDSDNPALRTFHVSVRPADGRAYADALAAHYGLTPATLARRLS